VSSDVSLGTTRGWCMKRGLCRDKLNVLETELRLVSEPSSVVEVHLNGG